MQTRQNEAVWMVNLEVKVSFLSHHIRVCLQLRWVILTSVPFLITMCHMIFQHYSNSYEWKLEWHFWDVPSILQLMANLVKLVFI